MKGSKVFTGLMIAALAVVTGLAGAQTENRGMQAAQNGRSGRGGQQVDKSGDTELQALIAETKDKFRAFGFFDEVTQDTMYYNLFIPEGYDPQQKYPLVLFIGDASTSQKDVSVPLTQGYGGLIWASEQEQAKHPAFVLVPQYKTKTVDDNFTTTAEVEETIRLLKSLFDTYSIDQDRVYKTGQSMGGMMSMHYGIEYPELFAASVYVGCQWDASKMQDFANQRFFYIVAEGDMKAPKGRAELTKVLEAQGAQIAQGNWSAKAPQAVQEAGVQKVLDAGSGINYITFDLGTVLPEGGGGNEHMSSFDYAYKLEGVRDWLFEQKRE